MTPEIALLNAIRTQLKTNAIDGIGQNVFDQIPTDIPPPYVYIGAAGRTRIVLDCYQAWAVRLRIYVIYTSWNRTQVWEAAEAAIQSLDLVTFMLPSPYFQEEPLKIIQAGDVVDPNAPKSVFVDLSATIARGT
jgi:hypothetical protein